MFSPRLAMISAVVSPPGAAARAFRMRTVRGSLKRSVTGALRPKRTGADCQAAASVERYRLRVGVLEIEDDEAAAWAAADICNAGDVDDETADCGSSVVAGIGKRFVPVHVPHSCPALSSLRHGQSKAFLLMPTGKSPAVMVNRIRPEDAQVKGDITGADDNREDRRDGLERTGVNTCSSAGLVCRPGQHCGVFHLGDRVRVQLEDAASFGRRGYCKHLATLTRLQKVCNWVPQQRRWRARPPASAFIAGRAGFGDSASAPVGSLVVTPTIGLTTMLRWQVSVMNRCAALPVIPRGIRLPVLIIDMDEPMPADAMAGLERILAAPCQSLERRAA
jgi:hypothetical protein